MASNPLPLSSDSLFRMAVAVFNSRESADWTSETATVFLTLVNQAMTLQHQEQHLAVEMAKATPIRTLRDN